MATFRINKKNKSRENRIYCLNCGTDITDKIKRHGQKYCSKVCANVKRTNGLCYNKEILEHSEMFETLNYKIHKTYNHY